MYDNINNWKTIPETELIFELYDITLCNVTLSHKRCRPSIVLG
jgi:hypothetical protein